MTYNYAVFILTYKRPDNQLSYRFLRENNYTGKIYLVVDDTDPTIEQLRNNVVSDKNTEILIFNKKEVANKMDTGLSEPMLNFAVFSRNAIEKSARELGYDYFVVFDDDVNAIVIRQLDSENKLRRHKLSNVDKLFNSVLDFMQSDSKIAILSPAQTLMFFNKNITNDLYNQKYRETGSVFFRRTSIEVEWNLNMLEDVITSYKMSRRGYVTSVISYLQAECGAFGGKVTGGNTDTYITFKNINNYFPMMMFPDVFYIYKNEKGECSRAKSSDYMCPMILSSKYRK